MLDIKQIRKSSFSIEEKLNSRNSTVEYSLILQDIKKLDHDQQVLEEKCTILNKKSNEIAKLVRKKKHQERNTYEK